MNFVSAINGVLLIIMGIAFYAFSAYSISLGIYGLGALLTLWAFAKTRSINMKLPSPDNDSALLKAHFVQKNGLKDKLEESLAALSLAASWPAYGVVIFFVGITSAAIIPSRDEKVRSRETSPLDFGVIADFMMPTQLLVQLSILVFSVWLSLSWGRIVGEDLQKILVYSLAVGLLSQYIGFLLKPNLSENFSKSILSSWVYIFLSFFLVLTCGLVARENISSLVGMTASPFKDFALFSVFQDWSVNGKFPFASIWSQSSSFSDLARLVLQEARSLGVVKAFDLMFLTGMSGTFVRNGIASIRYVPTDEDHAARSARFLKVGKVEKAAVEGSLVVDRQTYLANLAHVYLANREYDKFIKLCGEQVERGLFLRLGYSDVGKAYSLIAGYLISCEVSLSRGYEIFSRVIVDFADLSVSLAFWRCYSATQKLSLGDILSLYPEDAHMAEVYDYIKIADQHSFNPDVLFSEVDETFGVMNPAIFLTTSLLLASAGTESRNDRRTELVGKSIRRLFSRYVEEISGALTVRNIEPIEAFSVLELRAALTRFFDVPDEETVEVVKATLACLPDQSPMYVFLSQQLEKAAQN